MTSLAACFLCLALYPGQKANPPMSLTDVVKAGLVGSPRLRAAKYGAAAGRAQIEKERPMARPTVKAEAQGIAQGPRVTFPRAGGSDATVLPEEYARAELMLEQLLYRPGIGPARARYQAQLRANEWEYRNVENDLVLDVHKAYFGYLSAQALADVAAGGADLASKHFELTKIMHAAGTAMERDVKAADADVVEAEQGSSRARNGVGLARANLNRLMGRTPSQDLTVAPVATVPTVPTRPDDGIEMALIRRPEIKQIGEQLIAARAGIALAGSQNGPSISARGTASTQTPSAFVRSEYFAGTLVLTWNPFDGGRSRADVQEARARLSQLEALLEDAKLGMRLEVEKAWREMGEAAERIKAADRQVAAAESASDVSRLRFEARQATQLEVSGALLNVTKARTNRVQALYDLHIAAAEYRHATGIDVPQENPR